MIEGSNTPSLLIAAQLHQQGKLDEAIHEYQALIDQDPNATTCYLMGNCLAQGQKYEKAIPFLKHAIALDATLEDAYLNLAICQEENKQIEDAARTLTQALPRFPSNKRLHNRYGNIMLGQNQAKLASSHFKRAIEIDGNFIPAYLNLTRAYEALDNIDEGIKTLTSAKALVPDDAIVRNNLANLLRQKGEYKDAKKLLQCNIDSNLLLSESYHNLGLIKQDRGKIDEAQKLYQLALQHNPQNLLCQWNFNLLELMLGHWNNSLGMYNVGKVIGERPSLLAPIPEWKGENLEDKRLLIWHEQGIGEEILFSSVYDSLQGSTKQVTAICSPRLTNLFRHSFPSIEFLAKDDIGQIDIASFDFQVLAGDLPWLLRENPCQQPNDSGFLTSAKSSSKPNSNMKGKKRIGLSWRGGKNQHERRKRSLAISQFKTLLESDKYVFINLQHDTSDDEHTYLQSTAQQLEEHPDIDLKNDFDKLTELIDSLDAVVCCTNTISHLASALNIPTFMLTPASPTWYWLLKDTMVPWYSSLRLIRQTKPDSWNDEIVTATYSLDDLFA